MVKQDKNSKHEIPACRQAGKGLNSKQIAEKPKFPFEFYILDLLRV
jgi:hypothetical protein